MKTALLIIAPKMFRDEEYAEPRAVLELLGATVITASTRPGECVGKLGMRAEASISVRDALDEAWDAVAFIGGAGAQVFFDDPDAHQLARAALDSSSVLGAICIAPSTLAHAGLLDGVSATAFPSQKDDLIAHGARWTGEPVTVDDKVVTASGPEAAGAFGRALGRSMGLADERERAQP